MCGIAGYLDPHAHTVGAERVATMAGMLRHRGPDDAGTWLDPRHGLALGHQRLSIIDVSQAGHQPMLSSSGRYAVVLNGEIYNYRALRQALDDYPFRGHSDTETLTAYIEQFGFLPALQHAAGMFALACWDREDAVLYLARDRIGEKPLYYGYLGSAFAFASELRALRVHPNWRGDVDREALAQYLRTAVVAAPDCIYAGIEQLAPGHYLALHVNKGTDGPQSYWDAASVATSGVNGDLYRDVDEAIRATEHCLSEIIEQQMISDVPIGAFLSGGIDSSTVVALAQSQRRDQLQTFSIGFAEADFDESSHAAAVARHLGTRHEQLVVTPDDALAIVPTLAQVYDEPFADSSQIPTTLLARLTRDQVTVALSGDGADEIFGGYTRYNAGLRAWRSCQRWPGFAQKGLRGIAAALPEARWDKLNALLTRYLPQRFHYTQSGDKLRKLAALTEVSSEQGYYDLLTSHWHQPADVLRDYHSHSFTARPRSLDDIVQQMMLWDLQTYLPNDILVKVDRASMAVGLEVRCPFVDHRLVELAWKLPQQVKTHERGSKWILRQILYRYVPQALLERPKTGFAVPVGVWLTGPLRDWAEAQLSDTRLTEEGFFDCAVVRSLWRSHVNGEQDQLRKLWPILMFQAWWAEHGKAA